jgi:predicted nucleic acid-binding protein
MMDIKWRCGKSLSAMDMQIAAHAAANDATLVTHDQAFQRVTAFLNVVD